MVSGIDDGRHGLYLCLSGALCQAGVAPDRVLDIVAQVAGGAADSKAEARVHDAETTIAKLSAGQEITGFGTLCRDWPEVSAVLEDVLGEVGSEGFLRMQAELEARPLPALVDLVTATAVLTSTLHDAATRSESRVVRITLGAGKTTAAVEQAAATRQPTALVFGTNEQAAECARQLRLYRADVTRRAGALASVGGGCPHAVAATRLQGLGRSVPRQLCGQCQHRSRYPARHQGRSTSGAGVLVINHSLLEMALGHVGQDGLLLIDEPPPMFEHVVLSPSDYAEALEAVSGGAFFEPFGTAILPALMAASHAVQQYGLAVTPMSIASASRELSGSDQRFWGAMATGGSGFARLRPAPFQRRRGSAGAAVDRACRGDRERCGASPQPASHPAHAAGAHDQIRCQRSSCCGRCQGAAARGRHGDERVVVR